ncbi:aminodeoxychorismate lyase [Alteromonas macleodii]|uniref:Aminodeoxychorismate lyase n=1 Tax=Alteromonas macleodii TaxID=28108 RepID=A0A6T9Y1W5_ALTMA|nr:aminodeoxychorismate lyase [Alteromonas macleodii]CAB9493702.1 Aminodeoxychorismate lyase apoprotein [Alteromonas macleodii]
MIIIPSATPISSSDRAFNYGDGVFTTLMVNEHNVELLPYHLSRLEHDTAAIKLDIDIDTLEAAIAEQVEAIKKASEGSASTKYVLKVHVSGGQAGRGYARSEDSEPLIRFSQHPYPSHYDSLANDGVTAICAQTRLAIQPLLAGVKHMNRLEQVFVKHEVDEAGAHDAIVCDTQDSIIEASAGNLFFYLDDEWYTPSLKGSGVNGVVRQCLIDSLLNDNCVLHVGNYDLSFLRKASAVVITNALMGVMPVKQVRMTDFSVVNFDVKSDAVACLKARLTSAMKSGQ